MLVEQANTNCLSQMPLKVVSTSKCNIQRIRTLDRYFLLVCGDIELNPGPVIT